MLPANVLCSAAKKKPPETPESEGLYFLEVGTWIFGFRANRARFTTPQQRGEYWHNKN